MKTTIALWLILLGIVLAPLAYVGTQNGALAQQGLGYGQSVGPGGISPWNCYPSGCDSSSYVTPVTVSALSGCSTGGTPAVAGNQHRLLVTAGTTASTTCTITWPLTRQAAPNCSLTPHTAAAVGGFITVENATTLTWTFTSVASSVWDVVCFGP